LLGQQRFDKRLEFASGFTSPGEADELINATLIVLRFDRPEPLTGAIHLSAEFSFASRKCVTLQRMHGQSGCANVTRLNRWTRQVVVPATVATLDRAQMIH